MVGCAERNFDCECEECLECGSFDDCVHEQAMEIYADFAHDEKMNWTEEDEREYQMHEYLAMCDFDDDD